MESSTETLCGMWNLGSDPAMPAELVGLYKNREDTEQRVAGGPNSMEGDPPAFILRKHWALDE